MNVIAFDLGGSGGKVILANYKNTRLSCKILHKFEHAPISIGKNLYWDILRIFEELNWGIKKAIEQTDDHITSLGIDSFCNDYALISPSGELLTQVHCYRDSRTKEQEESIYNIISPKELYQINGNQNALFNTFMQLAAMSLNNQSYLFKNGNKLLFIPDLLIYFLTGQFTTEYTLASVSQLFDFNRNFWSTKILDHFNIPEELFPAIVQPGSNIGKTCVAYNEKMNTKGFSLVSVCEHDTASAFLASIYNTGCAIISCGTWAIVGTETSSPVINDIGYKYNIANEGGYEGHHRILRNVMGTWIIQEIRAHYSQDGVNYSYSDLEKLASSAPPFQYLVDVDDYIFFSPGNMPAKIQQYCMKRYGNYPKTIGEMVRCIYESLVFKFYWNIEKLSAYTNSDFKVINIIGGGSQSRLICQFTSNICCLPVTAGPVEAAALGNIMMQLLANKQIHSVTEGRQIIRNSCSTVKYHPENSVEWTNQYGLFKKQFNLA